MAATRTGARAGSHADDSLSLRPGSFFRREAARAGAWFAAIACMHRRMRRRCSRSSIASVSSCCDDEAIRLPEVGAGYPVAESKHAICRSRRHHLRRCLCSDRFADCVGSCRTNVIHGRRCAAQRHRCRCVARPRPDTYPTKRMLRQAQHRYVLVWRSSGRVPVASRQASLRQKSVFSRGFLLFVARLCHCRSLAGVDQMSFRAMR